MIEACTRHEDKSNFVSDNTMHNVESWMRFLQPATLDLSLSDSDSEFSSMPITEQHLLRKRIDAGREFSRRSETGRKFQIPSFAASEGGQQVALDDFALHP